MADDFAVCSAGPCVQSNLVRFDLGLSEASQFGVLGLGFHTHAH